MHAVLVGDERLCANAARLHQKLLSMTLPAGCRDVRVIYGRLAFRNCKNLVCVSVAIPARGGRSSLSCLAGPCVSAVRVCALRIGVALGARNLFRWRLVREPLYILMAIHATEHRAMDRVLELCSVNVEACLQPICFGRKRGVGVAAEAVLVFGLMFGASCEDPAKQK